MITHVGNAVHKPTLGIYTCGQRSTQAYIGNLTVLRTYIVNSKAKKTEPLWNVV